MVNLKGYITSTISDGHYPTYERFNRNTYGGPYVSYSLFNNKAHWHRLQGMQSLFDWYHTNPVFYACVMIKAREYGNLKVEVRRKKNHAVVPENTREPIPKKLYELFNKPNILQSRWEWMQQRKIFEEVAGNSFTYGNFTIGFKPSVGDLSALWNVWPANMQFQLAGKYFEATDIKEIIKQWKFEAGPYKKVWEPHEILHRNKANTNISDGLIFGRATAQSLVRPLTNIDVAYEARQVMMNNRGMRVIVTSAREDADGHIPIGEDDAKEVEDSFGEYGIREGQKQFWFNRFPLQVTPIDQDVTKLGLFDEIATDAMMCCNGWGVPEVLLKLYIRGATYENQEASVRRLYQGTLIPEAVDDFNSLGNFVGLDETEYYLAPNFSEVAALQESENAKLDTQQKKANLLMSELKMGLIDKKLYWERMGYGPIPADLLEEAKPPKPENEETEDEKRAKLAIAK